MVEETRICIFSEFLSTCNPDKVFDSKQLSDGLEVHGLNEWFYHKDCYATYTSNQKIARYLKRKKDVGEKGKLEIGSPTGKKLRR